MSARINRGDFVLCPECGEAVRVTLNYGYAKKVLITANHEPPGWPGAMCSGSSIAVKNLEKVPAPQ